MSKPDILSHVDLSKMALNTATLLLLIRLYLGFPITPAEASSVVTGLPTEVLDHQTSDSDLEILASSNEGFRDGEVVAVTGKGFNGSDMPWANSDTQENGGGGITLTDKHCEWKGKFKVGRVPRRKWVAEVYCYVNDRWTVLYVRLNQVKKLGSSQNNSKLRYADWQGKQISENELVTG